MASWGSCDFSELEKFRDRIEAMGNQKQIDAFCESCAKELAARLLRKVIQRTPVDKGTLRRGWTTSSSGDSIHDTKQAMYDNLFGGNQKVSKSNMKVEHIGNNYVIEVTNPVEYASYVEYGHRTINHEGWVDGHFMLTISEKELEATASAILEKKLLAKLKEVFQ